MKAAVLGEFGLIAHLAEVIASEERAASLGAAAPGPAGTPPARLLLGIGDDAAVWQLGDVLELATTDTLVERVHFLPQRTPWRDLGWKALAVNLSDIAAMGGIPLYALITLGLPPDAEVEHLTDLYRGMLEAAHTYGARLVGGDIVRSQVFFLTVALHGVAAGAGYPEGVLRRAAARPGEVVAVTGSLGASAAGLEVLRSGRPLSDEAAATLLREAHLRPRPRLAEGQALLRAGVRCAMDISDGLLADLSKLCAASGVAAQVELKQVPVLPAVRQHFPAWQSLALSGGEDYELLFTAPAAILAELQRQAAFPVTAIGTIAAGTPGQVTLVDAAGEPVPWQNGGWDHLARET
ncbi:MAG: thiamine-phosphate kinase [Chloroflexi bacterium]|nr:thiamine-phosphate kinase [Chloroflexota bacterium]